MLHEPTMQKLVAMRLHGMADALKTQQQDPAARELSFLERLALLVDHQWNWRQNQALVRRLDLAKLRGNICVPARARPLTNIDASNHIDGTSAANCRGYRGSSKRIIEMATACV